MFEGVVNEFEQLVGVDGPAVSLERGALLLAASIDERHTVDDGLALLDDLAAAAPAADVASLVAWLVEDLGFTGATEDYYLPTSSSLISAVEQRRSIPITLAVLLIEIARRRGLEVVGVGMPSHFLAFGDGRFIDLFHGGRLFGVDEARELHARIGRDPSTFEADTAAVGARAILYRMVANLRLASRARPELLARACRLAVSFPESGWGDHELLGRALEASGDPVAAAAALSRAAGLAPPDRASDLDRRAAELMAPYN